MSSFADILRGLDEAALTKLCAKVPSWNGLPLKIPSSLCIQQSSSEAAARYKASLFPPGLRVADLTGGLGVDSWAFSLNASEVLHNEPDLQLSEAVRHNFREAGVPNVQFSNVRIGAGEDDWRQVLESFRADVLYLDPSRRDAAGKKVFLLEQCSPDVVSLMPALLSLSPCVLVKVSPMADITMLRRRIQPWLSEIHVVGAEGECKELLCLCKAGADFGGVKLFENACSFDPSWSFSPSPEGLFFLPSAALVKSGLGPGACRIVHDTRLAPFGAFYRVLDELPFGGGSLRKVRSRYERAEISVRGLPFSAEQLRERLKMGPGGPIHIFALSLQGERRLLVCEKVTAPEQGV